MAKNDSNVIAIDCKLDTPDKISSVRRNKLTTFRRSKWLGCAGAN